MGGAIGLEELDDLLFLDIFNSTDKCKSFDNTIKSRFNVSTKMSGSVILE